MSKRGGKSSRTSWRTDSPRPDVIVSNRLGRPVRVVSTDARPSTPLARLQRTDLAQVLRQIEDRRLHHPERFDRPALNFRGMPAPVVVGRSSAKRSTKPVTWPSHVIRFEVPKDVLTCVRRSRRRQVMFATKKTGAGAKSPRRFSWRSKLSCKR